MRAFASAIRNLLCTKGHASYLKRKVASIQKSKIGKRVYVTIVRLCLCANSVMFRCRPVGQKNHEATALRYSTIS